MGLWSDFNLFLNNRSKFQAWMDEQAKTTWRKILVPPEEPWQQGIPVQWDKVQNDIRALGITGINERTIFSNVDGTYMLYPEALTLRILSQLPKPLYEYQLEYMDCDDLAEWDKVMMKQILLSIPIAYMEGYKPNYGHAFLYIPYIGGYIWHHINYDDVKSLEQITFCRI